MREEETDSSLALIMTGWGLGMTERVHVRREDASQGVSQGLSAQMSGEMPRSAHGVCHTKRMSMVACTHVG